MFREGVEMTRQSSLFDFERETHEVVIQRIQSRARDAIESQEVGVNV